MVSLTIDGRAVSVPESATILEAARQLGIQIPTLCWLQKVSPTGACRVCVVDVEGVARPMTACNTPVKEGIVVTTTNEKLEAIRKQVMELMLVNHPLDCPVCDAGGECDLQDTCYSFGVNRPEYQAHLNRKQIRYDWPLIESDPNRCILCEKCVKVDHEIVRSDVIEVVNRGEETIIDTHDGKSLNCDFCGNCVGACPVGALIDKPFKFRGRPWTYTVTRSTCGYCPVGCEIDYSARNGRVDRVTTTDDTYCHGNLCINGRYGFDYLNSDRRLKHPLVGGKQADWNGAMTLAAGRLKEIVATSGPDAVAGLSSPRLTNEEQFLFQKLFRTVLGSGNIDSEARFGFAPALEIIRKATGIGGATNPMDRIETAGAVLVIGSNLNAEATGYEYRVIRAATVNDARLVLANVADVKLKKIAHGQLRYRPGSEALLANGIAKLILAAGLEDKASAGIADLAGYSDALARLSLATVVEQTGVSEEALREAATLLGGKGSVAVLCGSELLRSGTPGAVEAVVNLALLAGAVGKEQGGLFPLHEKINIRGLLDMGGAPDLLPGGAAAPAGGRDLWQIVEGIERGQVKALYLIGVDPLVSFPEGGRLRKALEKLELLVVQDLFPTATAALAHVVFPASSSAEKSGTYTTIDGRLQQVAKALSSPGDAREDWDILTELSNRITGKSAVARPAQLLAEIREIIPGYGVTAPAPGPLSFAPDPAGAAPATAGFTLQVGPILFHNGATSTWSANNREVAPAPYVEILAADAAKLGIADGGAIRLTTAAGSLTGTAKITGRLQPGLLFAPHHFPEFPVSGLLTGNASLVAVKVEKG